MLTTEMLSDAELEVLVSDSYKAAERAREANGYRSLGEDHHLVKAANGAMEEYKRRHPPPKNCWYGMKLKVPLKTAHGVILEGTREICDTHQCCHCGGHFVVVKGSGVTRGFCLKCSGVTCGKPECSTRCVPMEAQLEQLEGKRNRWSMRP